MNTLSPPENPQTLLQYPDVSDLLIQQGKIRFRVISGSMIPRLKPGDLVDLEPVSWEMLKEGDIVGTRINGSIICHGLARWFEEDGKQWVVTKASRSGVEDSPALLSQVVGRVVRIRSPRLFHQLVWRLQIIFQPRPFWRLWIAKRIHTFIYTLIHGIEFFILAFLRPDDLIESNRRYFETPNQVKQYTNKGSMKLNPVEAQVLEHFVRPRAGGKVLVLGCGGGREMSVLAERGWEVVGIDQSLSLIRAAKEMFRECSKMKWYHRDLNKGIRLNGTQFNFICLLGHLYSLIPTRKRRVQLLQDCRAHLKPDGVCFLAFSSAPISPPSRIKQWAHRLRRTLARIAGGNPDCELGDRWQGGLFSHQFYSPEEIMEETRLAGFDVLWVNPEFGLRILVLTPQSSAV